MGKSIIWAVDFGDRKVTALAAEARSGGQLSLAGSAQVLTQGLERGEFTNAGDVTECLVAALRGAEKASGLKSDAIFFNFDDALLESHFPTGTQTLAGEGQIRPADVEQAVSSARRFVSHFEKTKIQIHEFLIQFLDRLFDSQ